VNKPIDLDSRVQSAAHRLCAAGGLRAIGFRSVAREADVSVGQTGHRYGSLEGLMDRLVELEAQDLGRWFAFWQDRIGGPGGRAGLPLADILVEILEDAVVNRRLSTMLQAELLVAPGFDMRVRPLGTVWIEGWRGLVEHRHPLGQHVAPLQAGLMADEAAFSLAFGTLPPYRLIRKAALSHLLAGFPETEPAELPALFRELESLSITAQPQSAAGRTASLSEAIADLLEEEGAGAVSHRALAARAGVPNSTVAHHFRTSEKLIEAGMASLYDRFRRASIGPNDPAMLNRIGRSTHSVALAAARDPRFLPYAIDMRWRRGENFRRVLPGLLRGSHSKPWTLTAQALSIAIIGQSLLDPPSGPSDVSVASRALESLRRLQA
jgi:DNA-binding transcriptional regulator YbjK